MELKKQILVVEDNQLNREMLAEILSERYIVLQAENGKEALEILKHNRDSIDLILLDVVMPVMDGYAFLDKIKEDEELSCIPVIVTTQGDSEEDEVSALEHGATDFVPKPYRPRVILNRMESLIKLRETSAIVNQFKYDRLTGLYNKEFFYQKVREQLLAEPDREYCIICSNIENFKLYNDTFGVLAGDELLKEIAGFFKELVGDESFCGRFSADRFMCLAKTDKNRFDFAKHRLSGLSGSKTAIVRWGIYDITDLSITVEQMCDRALLAADSIKGRYNKYFAVYDDELRNKLLREKAITDTMEYALADGQFIVYLQPKYSLKDNCMVGAEALVRWIHPKWGFMSPGEFIPLFEQNGFISNLDKYIWESVCKQLHTWQEQGHVLPVISVNVSRADVYLSDLVGTLLEMTRKYEIDPKYLHLEITESAYAKNPMQIINTVESLRRLGFVIEIDDFGSGYSSLNMLGHMNVDILKLDMKFIQNEVAKPEERSILNDVINMAHRIHLSVVAEGIETREQMNHLQSMGCDYAQGYFFAKPMPVDEFEKLWMGQSSKKENAMLSEQHRDDPMRVLLVADEDDAYREKVKAAFKEQYRIFETSNADSAAKYIKSCGKGETAAVILSMTLPENGAAAFLKMFRSDPEFWNVPVLATIPKGENLCDLQTAFEADDFICKQHPMFDVRRRIQRLLDIASLKEKENDLSNAAYNDYLTDLLNRRGFQVAADSLRAEDFPLALCLFDLDDLKEVNDTRGHKIGDRMLCTFADLLIRQTRTSDIRCRYGGDEFLLVLKHINNAETAMKKGNAICREFQKLLEEENLSVSCSGGIVMCDAYEKLSDKTIERADRALYNVKRDNKGGCCLLEG